MGLDPSAHLAARSALKSRRMARGFSLHRAFGKAARNGQDRSLQTSRKFAMFPFTFYEKAWYRRRHTFTQVRVAAMSRAGHAPPLPRSKTQRPLPRPYRAPIQNVRVERAHHNFYLLSIIFYLKTAR